MKEQSLPMIDHVDEAAVHLIDGAAQIALILPPPVLAGFVLWAYWRGKNA